eukprot:gene14091-20043_t
MSFMSKIFGWSGSKELQALPGQSISKKSMILVSEADEDSSDSDSDDVLVAPLTTVSRARPNLRSTTSSNLGAGARVGFEDFSREGRVVRRSRSSIIMNETMSASAIPMMNGSFGALQSPFQQTYSGLRPFKNSRASRRSGYQLMEGVERKTGKVVVIRVFPRDSLTTAQRDMMDRELSTLSQTADCVGTVRLLDRDEDPTYYYTIMELCPGQNLIELVASGGGRMSELRCAIEIGLPLVKAVAELHAKGLVHRGLKPEHVMCNQGGLKLLDLFESGDKKAQCLNNRTGQMEYSAPEMLDKPRVEEIFHEVLFKGMAEEELPQYDEKVDVWSIGVIVYETLTGCQPFRGDSSKDVMQMQTELLHSTTTGAPVPQFISKFGLSKEAQNFLLQCFAMDPASRPSVSELVAHPWLVAQQKLFAAGLK